LNLNRESITIGFNSVYYLLTLHS